MDLFSYACCGDVQRLTELLSTTTLKQKDLDTALQMACEMGRLQSVKVLVSKGANIFADDNYAMYLACKYNQTNVIEYLLSAGCFPIEL